MGQSRNYEYKEEDQNCLDLRVLMQGRWQRHHQSHTLFQMNSGLQTRLFLKRLLLKIWKYVDFFVNALLFHQVNTEMIYQITQQTNCTFAETKIWKENGFTNLPYGTVQMRKSWMIFYLHYLFHSTVFIRKKILNTLR